MAIIRFAALDGSKANFGIAKLDYDTTTDTLHVAGLRLIKTEKTKIKGVRISSDNLRRGQEIAVALREELADCALAFAEIPSGAQSADAAYAFGMVVGLYSCITIPLVEVTPSETKLAAVGTRTASKDEIINWAAERFPDAPWLRVKRGGVMVPTKANEHLADAVAIAHAGIRLPVFRQTVAMVSAMGKAA